MKTFRIATLGLPDDDGTHRLALANHPRFELVSAEADDLDAVVVASPPSEHLDSVLEALARGLHVIVQPPFAPNVADAERMSAAAKSAKLACGVSYEFRFVSEAQAIKELIVNKHLGPLRSMDVTRQNGALRKAVRTARSWWFDRGGGAGAAATGLSHSIDLALWFAARPPKAVAGFTRTANPEREDREGTFQATADDGAFALLDFGDGLVARLTEDRTSPVDSYVCAVYGEHRVAVASGRDVDETTLYTVDDDETNELECAPSRHAKTASKFENVILLLELYDELAKQIETGTSALPTFADALEVQRVLTLLAPRT
jgi:predicted dehydrogenase